MEQQPRYCGAYQPIVYITHTCVLKAVWICEVLLSKYIYMPPMREVKLMKCLLDLSINLLHSLAVLRG